MLAKQDGLCAVCQMAPAGHVDHDHDTGKVRGLLCFNCNGGLGQFKDRIDILAAAVDYLKSHAVSAETSTNPSRRSPARGHWPRVVELFPCRGPDIETVRLRNAAGA
ncbi:MAG: endonuclease VII domain-containing protein [Actinomycetota bacterium]|nr:endonuclease VII domain-containing protein [Actinomycetota bacterium]